MWFKFVAGYTGYVKVEHVIAFETYYSSGYVIRAVLTNGATLVASERFNTEAEARSAIEAILPTIMTSTPQIRSVDFSQ